MISSMRQFLESNIAESTLPRVCATLASMVENELILSQYMQYVRVYGVARVRDIAHRRFLGRSIGVLVGRILPCSGTIPFVNKYLMRGVVVLKKKTEVLQDTCCL